ncbi:hypothetical protein KUTeg_014868 [Tegillarca granosa]|uniref:Uncharacterized protein n=1 Tax=Tegillarca granosa TaxID=220873 RepID=A0ABQ9EQT3_TEGGR|nr:hypothetical protein KUTeg_014868 [Tegillarca granosa]
MRRIWVCEGRPRGRQHQSYSNYKDAKRQFRNTLQNACDSYLQRTYQDIDDAAGCDIRLFMKLVSKQRPRKNKVYPEIVYKDQMYKDPVGVAEAFSRYYSDVFKPKNDKNFNNDNVIRVENDKQLQLRSDRTNSDSDIDRFKTIHDVSHPDAATVWKFPENRQELQLARFIAKLTVVPRQTENVTCEHCERQYNDLLSHALCSCVKTEFYRNILFQVVLDNFHINLSTELASYDEETLTQILLGRKSQTTLSPPDLKHFLFICFTYVKASASAYVK